jgi:MurNAc alpha-1-phosphate uridylyltransferase
MRAMILAAGRGERMRPLTDHAPKPLLKAGGRMLIEWHLDALGRAGIREVVINHAHLGSMIERALGDGSDRNMRLIYSPESPALETAGGIRHALQHLGEGPFLVVNGDIHTDFDYGRARTVAVQMLAAGLDSWCVLVRNPVHHPDGDFELSDGRLAVSSSPSASRRLTFSGIGVYRPELFRALTDGEAAKLAPLLRAAAAAGRAGAEFHPGHWTDVGTPERLESLNIFLSTTQPIKAKRCNPTH